MTDPILSPLHDRHVALGAKFSEFGGWLMPLQYSGVVAEHRAVRERVGIFDVSHLGKMRVRGEGAAAFVNEWLTNDLRRIGPGQAQYTLLCNEQGGVVDDMIAYLFSEDEVFVIPNAANTATVVDIVSSAAPSGVTVTRRVVRFSSRVRRWASSVWISLVTVAFGMSSEPDARVNVPASTTRAKARIAASWS